MPWIAIAASVVAPMIIGQLTGSGKKREASNEIPGMMEAIQQSLQARQNALTYADAAANPDSPWFRNLSALYREASYPEIMRGVKEGMLQQQRLTARGVPVSFVRNPERRDESFYSSLARAYQGANVQSRTAAQNQLLGASRAAGGSAGDPSSMFKILQQFGQAEADRKSSQTSSFSNIFSSLLGGFGGGFNGGIGSAGSGIGLGAGDFGGDFGAGGAGFGIGSSPSTIGLAWP